MSDSNDQRGGTPSDERPTEVMTPVTTTQSDTVAGVVPPRRSRTVPVLSMLLVLAIIAAVFGWLLYAGARDDAKAKPAPRVNDNSAKVESLEAKVKGLQQEVKDLNVQLEDAQSNPSSDNGIPPSSEEGLGQEDEEAVLKLATVAIGELNTGDDLSKCPIRIVGADATAMWMIAGADSSAKGCQMKKAPRVEVLYHRVDGTWEQEDAQTPGYAICATESDATGAKLEAIKQICAQDADLLP